MRQDRKLGVLAGGDVRTRRDRRLGVLAATAVLIAAVGMATYWLGASGAAGPAAQTALAADFQRAVTALQGRRLGEAERALSEILRRAPRLPEAHVNMGFAQLDLGLPGAAADYFATAIELRAAQVNAYYGLAVALERGGDLRGALGAMRSYVHLTQADDPHLPKARAALWEWESQLAPAGAKEGVSP